MMTKIIFTRRLAGVAQWQSRSFPSLRRGFDSLHPLQSLDLAQHRLRILDAAECFYDDRFSQPLESLEEGLNIEFLCELHIKIGRKKHRLEVRFVSTGGFNRSF